MLDITDCIKDSAELEAVLLNLDTENTDLTQNIRYVPHKYLAISVFTLKIFCIIFLELKTVTVFTATYIFF